MTSGPCDLCCVFQLAAEYISTHTKAIIVKSNEYYVLHLVLCRPTQVMREDKKSKHLAKHVFKLR